MLIFVLENVRGGAKSLLYKELQSLSFRMEKPLRGKTRAASGEIKSAKENFKVSRREQAIEPSVSAINTPNNPTL
jgi:hypothetical protein